MLAVLYCVNKISMSIISSCLFIYLVFRFQQNVLAWMVQQVYERIVMCFKQEVGFAKQ